MSALMTSAQFPAIVEATMTTYFDGAYKSYQPEYSKVFKSIKGFKRRTHEHAVMAGLGNAQEKAEGQNFTFDSGAEIYRVSFVYKAFGLGYAITEEMQEDDEALPFAQMFSKSLAKALNESKELQHTAFLDAAFTTVLPALGTPLLSAAHPVYGGGTASNLIAPAQLSVASLTAIRQGIRKAKNERNQPISLKIKQLIIPPALGPTAFTILNSQFLPNAGAENAVNHIVGMGEYKADKVVELTRLTSDTAFFVQTDAEDDALVHIPRQGIKKGMFKDGENNNLKYTARERYALGALGWRGLWGCLGQ